MSKSKKKNSKSLRNNPNTMSQLQKIVYTNAQGAPLQFGQTETYRLEKSDKMLIDFLTATDYTTLADIFKACSVLKKSGKNVREGDSMGLRIGNVVINIVTKSNVSTTFNKHFENEQSTRNVNTTVPRICACAALAIIARAKGTYANLPALTDEEKNLLIINPIANSFGMAPMNAASLNNDNSGAFESYLINGPGLKFFYGSETYRNFAIAVALRRIERSQVESMTNAIHEDMARSKISSDMTLLQYMTEKQGEISTVYLSSAKWYKTPDRQLDANITAVKTMLSVILEGAKPGTS